MATSIGNLEIGDVAVGGTTATALAIGSVTVWSKDAPETPFYNKAPTKVWYYDGTSAEYNIVGKADKVNVLSVSSVEKIEFGNTVTALADSIFKSSTKLKYIYTGYNCSSLG